MGEFSDFQRGQFVGARLAGTSVTKSSTVLGVSRAAVSKVMSAYTNHGKTTATKRNSGRTSTLTERIIIYWKDSFEKYRWTTAAQVTAELNIHLPQNLSSVRLRLTNPTSTVGLKLLNLWLLKVMLRCVNDGVTTMTPENQTTVSAIAIWSNESSFILFPTSGKVYFGRTPKEAWFQQWNTGGVSAMVWATILWYSVGPIITLHGRITAREYVDRLGNQVHPMIQTLFPNNDAVFQEDNAPLPTVGTVQWWFEEHEGKLQHLPWPA
jgi:transposase